MAYGRLRILAPAHNSGDSDDCCTDHQRFNVQFLRAFGVTSKQHLYHRQGTECYSFRADDTYSQVREAHSMGLVFMKSQKGLISAHQKTSASRKSTSTDLHVSNGSGPISMCYASLAAAAALY